MQHLFYPALVDWNGEPEDFQIKLPDLGVFLTVPCSQDPYLAALDAAAEDIETRQTNRETPPAPTALSKLVRRGRAAPHMIFVVPVPIRRSYVRVILSLNPVLLHQIDQDADALGMTRSAWVTRLATARLQAAA